MIRARQDLVRLEGPVLTVSADLLPHKASSALLPFQPSLELLTFRSLPQAGLLPHPPRILPRTELPKPNKASLTPLHEHRGLDLWGKVCHHKGLWDTSTGQCFAVLPLHLCGRKRPGTQGMH